MNQHGAQNMSKVLRNAAVCEMLSISRTTLWRRERDGDFPDRVGLGGKSHGWMEDDIIAWLKARPRGLKSSR